MPALELRLTPRLTPHGRLLLAPEPDAPELSAAQAERLATAFARGSGHGLLQLGAAEQGESLSPALVYWRDLAARYVTELCLRDADAPLAPIPPPAGDDLEALAGAAPVMPGAEYATADVLRALWLELGEALAERRAEARLALPEFLKRLNPAWNMVGRVHFNLAENRRDEQAPFAFLATYTHALSAHGKVQHLPLGQALQEYAGRAQKERLLALLLPVQRAAEGCGWLKELVDAGQIFHPLRFTAREAVRFLGDVPGFERAGVVVRMPANWKGGRPARPQVTATVGIKAPASLGADGLLDFSLQVTLDGEELGRDELQALLAGSDGLALVRGRWVEVDAERLRQALARFREAQQVAAREGLTFAEAMRALAGADIAADDAVAAGDPEWSRVVAGPWLAETLRHLRAPEAADGFEPGRGLRGTLRPYQAVGVRWLRLLSRLGLGACLADDMGLGKTIQVLSLLLAEREREAAERRPSLLVAPASLLANWAAEIERFAPGLRALIAHPSALPAEELARLDAARAAEYDVVIVTYAGLSRLPWLATAAWNLAILDEAQAIKNPDARQTRAAKRLQARARLALTGTPVENRLTDLWSIFDFINPGLLGSARQFAGYAKRLAQNAHNPWGPLRELVRPYILRRLKTDRSVIQDLPDKTELDAWCALTRRQAALYQQAVDELAEGLRAADGIRRQGLVLSFLTRFKQICNHPSHWLGDGAWGEADSGKWARLREISEVIAAKQEKALVFTQFRELTAPLAAFLAEVFGRPGLVLHGDTPVKKRRELVERFQSDEELPFFVLSLKAGGSGLNLTAASHVVHFDRWWNPAVEDQASDRAFRIGQTRNVLVHKFVCRGTIEERIDALIRSKQALARDLLEGGAELDLTRLRDDELLRLVALDIHAALKE
jgi:non-specific serine/threonine protein kinase